MSVKTLRCGVPRARESARLPGDWAGRRRRSRVSCAATPLPVPTGWTTRPRPLSGMPSDVPAARRRPSWSPTTGCAGTPWKGRNKPHRGDRPWVTAWSPEQIARRLPVDFPDDETMRISHEAIYQALYVETRGALKRELVTCLRRGRALRVPRARTRQKAWAHVTPDTLISQRPPEVADRAVPGHWEGDLLIGLQRSAIGTLVERSSRFTMLIHLPREDGYGVIPRTKNGPALAGYGALTMATALAK